MISVEEAKRRYEAGYRAGDARRVAGMSPPISPGDADSFWFQHGAQDGFVRNPFQSFVFADGAVGDPDEVRAYEQGFNQQPLSLPYLAGWYASGKADRDANRPPTWLIRSENIGANRPPAPVGPPGPGPVIVAAPPYRYPPSGDPYGGSPPPYGPYGGYPSPYGPYGGYPPPFPRRWRPRRPGLVIRGPWGEIDLSELAAALGNPQPVRPGELLY